VPPTNCRQRRSGAPVCYNWRRRRHQNGGSGGGGVAAAAHSSKTHYAMHNIAYTQA